MVLLYGGIEVVAVIVADKEYDRLVWMMFKRFHDLMRRIAPVVEYKKKAVGFHNETAVVEISDFCCHGLVFFNFHRRQSLDLFRCAPVLIGNFN